MPLKSFLFDGNARLESCLVSDPAHVKPGDVGPHVRDIQIALEFIDALVISEAEKKAQRYGPSTAAAVLAYKKKRKIVNRSYETTEDNIVGKMTMAALDNDMLERQTTPRPPHDARCTQCGCLPLPPGDQRPAGPVPVDIARLLQKEPTSILTLQVQGLAARRPR